MLRKFLLTVMVVFFSSGAFAEWTPKREIVYLKAQSSGVYVKLEGFSSSDSVFSCGDNGFLLLEGSANYQAKVSMLLTAYMSKTPTKFSYYGCDSSSNAMASVAF